MLLLVSLAGRAAIGQILAHEGEAEYRRRRQDAEFVVLLDFLNHLLDTLGDELHGHVERIAMLGDDTSRSEQVERGNEVQIKFSNGQFWRHNMT